MKNTITEKKYIDIPILQEFDSHFGPIYWNNELKYNVKREDIEYIFATVNKFYFNGFLKPIVLMTPSETWCKKHGNVNGGFFFALYEDDGRFKFLAKTPSIFVKRAKHTNLINIAATLAHEMIHFDDFLEGYLSKIYTENYHKINNRTFIGNYDVYGNYFMKHLNQMQFKYGIPV